MRLRGGKIIFNGFERCGNAYAFRFPICNWRLLLPYERDAFMLQLQTVLREHDYLIVKVRDQESFTSIRYYLDEYNISYWKKMFDWLDDLHCLRNGEINDGVVFQIFRDENRHDNIVAIKALLTETVAHLHHLLETVVQMRVPALYLKRFSIKRTHDHLSLHPFLQDNGR